MVAISPLLQNNTSRHTGRLANFFGITIFVAVLCFCAFALSWSPSKKTEMISDYWLAATDEVPSFSVSKIYDPNYVSNGKWTWSEFHGDAPVTSYAPSFHLHPAAPAPVAPTIPSNTAATLPASDAVDDTDHYLYDSWTGGWRAEN